MRCTSKQKHRRDECAGWLQGDAYAGNDVADGLAVRGVTDDVSHIRSGTLERLDSQVSAADCF